MVFLRRQTCAALAQNPGDATGEGVPECPNPELASLVGFRFYVFYTEFANST